MVMRKLAERFGVHVGWHGEDFFSRQIQAGNTTILGLKKLDDHVCVFRCRINRNFYSAFYRSLHLHLCIPHLPLHLPLHLVVRPTHLLCNEYHSLQMFKKIVKINVYCGRVPQSYIAVTTIFLIFLFMRLSACQLVVWLLHPRTWFLVLPFF